MDKYLENAYKTAYRRLYKFCLMIERLENISGPAFKEVMYKGLKAIFLQVSFFSEKITEDVSQIEEQIRHEEDNNIQRIEEKLNQGGDDLLDFAEETLKKYLINQADPAINNKDGSHYDIYLNDLYYLFVLTHVTAALPDDVYTKVYIKSLSGAISYIERMITNCLVALTNPRFIRHHDYLKDVYNHYSLFLTTYEDEKKYRLGNKKETC